MPVPQNIPSHAKEVFERIMESLKGKTNPRTKEPYTDEERGKIAWAAIKEKYKKVGEKWEAKSEDDYGFEPIFSELEFKAENGKHYFKGYLSTGDVDLVNDLVTSDCMKDMLNQINAGIVGYVRSLKGSLDHDVYWSNDQQKTPISKITSGQLDGRGLFIEGIFNADHPEFPKVWSQIQNGFLDGLSIEYRPVDFAFKDMSGKKVRVLNKVLLKGYGHTPRPANPYSKLTDFFVKSLELADAEEMVKSSLENEIKAHLEKDIREYNAMIEDDKQFLEKLSVSAFPKIQGDSEEKATTSPDIKTEEKTMEKVEELKAEPQPVPQIEVKEEPKKEEKEESEEEKKKKKDSEKKPEKVEEKKEEPKPEVKAEVKPITLEEIKALIKEELKSIAPEKKGLSDAPSEHPLEVKSEQTNLTREIVRRLGG